MLLACKRRSKNKHQGELGDLTFMSIDISTERCGCPQSGRLGLDSYACAE